MNKKEMYVCDEVDEMKGLLSLNYPIEHGIINDWDGINFEQREVYHLSDNFIKDGIASEILRRSPESIGLN